MTPDANTVPPSIRFLVFAAGFGVVALTVYVLVIGKFLLLPLVVAVLIWYFLSRLTAAYERISVRGWHPPYWLALSVAIISAALILQGLSLLVGTSLREVSQAAPEYQARLKDLIGSASAFFGTDLLDRETLFDHLSPTMIISRLALGISGLAGDVGLILIYVIFLLLEHNKMQPKLRQLFADERRYDEVSRLLHRVGESVNTYMKIKSGTSALTGLLSFVVLAAFGVDFAPFWGLLFFLLNFIPSVGSIIAVVLVLVIVVVQFMSVATFLAVGTLLIGIQILVGNVLEPRWMGTSLNLSPMVLLVALVFWGSVWGVMGMVLCVPAMVIINMALSAFPRTRPIAILLSADGRLESISAR